MRITAQLEGRARPLVSPSARPGLLWASGLQMACLEIPFSRLQRRAPYAPLEKCARLAHSRYSTQLTALRATIACRAQHLSALTSRRALAQLGPSRSGMRPCAQLVRSVDSGPRSRRRGRPAAVRAQPEECRQTPGSGRPIVPATRALRAIFAPKERRTRQLCLRHVLLEVFAQRGPPRR